MGDFLPVKRGPGRPRKNPIMQNDTRPELRRDVRPEMRDDDPRARAARRAAEIRGHLGDEVEGVDDFRAPPAPPGWTYEWKRDTVYNQPDPAYHVSLKLTGWDEVPASRHPEMMPFGSGEGQIKRKGMVLMERPAEITNEFRAREQGVARQQVKIKEQQLSGEAVSPLGPNVRPDIKKGYEPLRVPEE